MLPRILSLYFRSLDLTLRNCSISAFNIFFWPFSVSVDSYEIFDFNLSGKPTVDYKLQLCKGSYFEGPTLSREVLISCSHTVMHINLRNLKLFLYKIDNMLKLIYKHIAQSPDS